jgi:hypothetical protein
MGPGSSFLKDINPREKVNDTKINIFEGLEQDSQFGARFLQNEMSDNGHIQESPSKKTGSLKKFLIKF